MTIELNYPSESKNLELAQNYPTPSYNYGRIASKNILITLLSLGKTNLDTGLHSHTNNTIIKQ